MTVDAYESLKNFRLRRLSAAADLIVRAEVLCRQVLAAQGDVPEQETLALQYDLVEWARCNPEAVVEADLGDVQ